MLAGKLLHGFELEYGATKWIGMYVEKFMRLASAFKHERRWETQHASDTAQLVILRCARKNGEPKE